MTIDSPLEKRFFSSEFGLLDAEYSLVVNFGG